MIEPVFNPLDKEEFKRRIENSFPNVYLTFISIIQGVALGILVTNTFVYINAVTANDLSWTRYLPYSIMSFVLLMIMSYEYTWFVGVFRWSPKVLDTVVPFVLGASEITPTFFLAQPRKWWITTAIFCILGAIGFWNSLRNCKKSMFPGNIKAYELTSAALKSDILIALLFALSCFIASNLSLNRFNNWEIPFYLLFVALSAAMIAREERFMKKLHEAFGLIRYIKE